ncbi:unnamed protein product [Heterobilharzia americana]|nr:unnamed protein product [Heterobilharzia americana]
MYLPINQLSDFSSQPVSGSNLSRNKETLKQKSYQVIGTNNQVFPCRENHHHHHRQSTEYYTINKMQQLDRLNNLNQNENHPMKCGDLAANSICNRNKFYSGCIGSVCYIRLNRLIRKLQHLTDHYQNHLQTCSCVVQQNCPNIRNTLNQINCLTTDQKFSIPSMQSEMLTCSHPPGLLFSSSSKDCLYTSNLHNKLITNDVNHNTNEIEMPTKDGNRSKTLLAQSIPLCITPTSDSEVCCAVTVRPCQKILNVNSKLPSSIKHFTGIHENKKNLSQSTLPVISKVVEDPVVSKKIAWR